MTISPEDFARLAAAFQRLGVTKIRLTGRGYDEVRVFGASVAETLDAYRRQVVLVCAVSAQAAVTTAEADLAAARMRAEMVAPFVAG